MEQRIGDTAGEIWKALKKSGETSISKVPKIVKQKDTLTYLALGWLAREGKLVFRSSGNSTLVSLSGKN